MKIIEAMNAIKMGNDKIADLQKKINMNSAHLSHESPHYANPADQIKEWQQSIHDTGKENMRLKIGIQRTNLATMVPIKMTNGNVVTRSIAEWVLRRHDYSIKDLSAWVELTDRGLRDQMVNTSTPGEKMEIKVVRNFDPKVRDAKILEFKSEPQLIDGALQVANATTDLLE